MKNYLTVQEGEERETSFRVDIGFTKGVTEADGTVVISGYAATWNTLDRVGDTIDPKAFDEALEVFKKNPTLCWLHDRQKVIGEITTFKKDDVGLFIEARIPKPAEGSEPWAITAYDKVRTGIYKALSIGGKWVHAFNKTIGRPYIKKVTDLFEVSVVGVPCNPDTVFAVATKQFEDEPTTIVTNQVVEQMMQVLGIRKCTDPQLVELTESELELKYVELGEIYEKAGFQVPARNVWSDLVAARESGELKAVEAVPQVQAILQLVRGATGADKMPDMEAAKEQIKIASRALSAAMEYFWACERVQATTTLDANGATPAEVELY
jgi:HK97 family phage prohead protease